MILKGLEKRLKALEIRGSVTEQPSSPNTDLIPLPIRWSRYSDISTDNMTDLLSAHIVFFRSRH